MHRWYESTYNTTYIAISLSCYAIFYSVHGKWKCITGIHVACEFCFNIMLKIWSRIKSYCLPSFSSRQWATYSLSAHHVCHTLLSIRTLDPQRLKLSSLPTICSKWIAMITCPNTLWSRKNSLRSHVHSWMMVVMTLHTMNEQCLNIHKWRI